MKNYSEEPRPEKNGSACHFTVHPQEQHGPGPMCAAHVHDYIELIYCQSGEFDFLINGRRYRAADGDMVLISSRDIHHITALSENTNHYIVVRFDPELLYTSYQNAFEMKYMLPFTLSGAAPQKVFCTSEIRDTFVPGLFYELLADYSTQSYGFELAVRTNICRIFLWILRYWNQMGIELHTLSESNSEALQQFQQALDYMNANYSQNITARDLAELCHMSYSYFSRMFKRHMHRSFREYLNYIRISKAEILLATSDLSMTEIAMRTGFSTSSYFIQQFRLRKQLSPKQYRKRFLTANV